MTRPFHKNLFFYLGERFSGRGNGDMKKKKTLRAVALATTTTIIFFNFRKKVVFKFKRNLKIEFTKMYCYSHC